ncbi:glycine betaine ABC transporter substrate-binding protein [Pontibacillus marinus]|uniref:ABC-type glycine betaine transport system substrate-binding domain-containing protein n=1 Tax=Pontibacillus marinus BH030004 = DSM 16465 TaxID=1385511 RepID=A0A0A5G9V7_9BACI|nr:glycine betaine ABC transporter substrate-binding protein [Pontibacillus marinus]KGX89946.1 hypothetical protein N783_03395 [Pontibacillus marinus BH030004 = DSM 16465]
MKKQLLIVLSAMFLIVLSACGQSSTGEEETNNTDQKEKETIVLGETSWTSTKLPNQIMKKILEEAGYNVNIKQVSQPLIFKGMQKQEIDVFMDAWLPYTEAELWSKYKEDVQKVTASYKEVPLGWVVPSYVEESSIAELKGKAEKFEERVVTIAAGAGIVDISKDVIKDYSLDGYDLVTSGEATMIATLEDSIEDKEPVIITGWRPHSMFAKNDLKFLEDPKGNFKKDNVYVLSYKGLEKDHPEAFKVLSDWSIKVSELEEMMLAYEQNDVSFEESAEKWIEEHRDQVDKMLNTEN